MIGEVANSYIPESWVVMEDDPTYQEIITTALHDFGCEVVLASGREDVERLASSGHSHFILDVHMGSGPRANEGLNATESVKKLNPSSYVAILSNYRRIKEAQRAGANAYWEKTADKRSDVLRLLCQNHLDTIVQRMIHEIPGHLMRPALITIERMLLPDTQQFGIVPPRNQNLRAFRNIVADPNLRKLYANHWVCIIDGEVEDSDLDRSKLELRAEGLEPQKPRVIDRVPGVGQSDREVPVSLPMSLVDFDIK